jgi:hypothetical protein
LLGPTSTRKARAEFVAPASNRFIADDDPALEQQRFEVAKAWLNLEIPVHGAAENGCWKAVAVMKQARCRDAG